MKRRSTFSSFRRPSTAFLFAILVVSDPVRVYAATATPETKIFRARVEGAAGATSVLKLKANGTLSRVDACYRKALVRNKGTVARLMMDVTISPDGRVKKVEADRSSNAPDGLTKCVADLVKRWKLAPWTLKHTVIAGLGYDFSLVAVPPKGAVVRGGLTIKYIAGVYVARHSELRACITQQLTKELKLKSTVIVQFDGSVGGSTVTGKWNGKDKRCMTKKMKSWVFPHGHHGHRSYARYPLVFKP